MCNVSDSVAKAGDADVNDDDLEDDKCPDAGEPSVSLAHLVDAVGGLPVGPRRASGSLVGAGYIADKCHKTYTWTVND